MVWDAQAAFFSNAFSLWPYGMKTVQYRRWQPARSPVCIEFLPAVLQQIRSETKQDHDRGFLFGTRQQNDLRMFAARRAPRLDDPQLRGTVPVGIYISRARGEVFLTDPDIAFMDQHRTAVALVVAGARAGFFVRETDGTLQAVRSYEEFAVADAATMPAPRRAIRYSPPVAPQHWRWPAAVASLLAVPAVALAYWLPPAPIEIEARERYGQLVVSWDARALERGGRLEIVDGSKRTVLRLARGTTGATYLVQSAAVDVRLSTDTRTGYLHWVKR